GAIDETPYARASVAEIAHAPDCCGKARLELIAPSANVRACRQFQAIGVVDEAARLQESGRRQASVGHHQPRPQDEDADATVRLARQDGAYLVLRRADTQAIADLEAEPFEQIRIGNRAPMPIALRKRLLQRLLRLQLRGSIERVRAVDGLQLDEGALIAGERP